MFFRVWLSYRRLNRSLLRLDEALRAPDTPGLGAEALDRHDGLPAEILRSRIARKRQMLPGLLRRRLRRNVGNVVTFTRSRMSHDGCAFDLEGFRDDISRALREGRLTADDVGDWAEQVELELLMAASASQGAMDADGNLASRLHDATEMLGQADDDAFIASGCEYEPWLESDPAAIYSRMDAATRQRYRESLEAGARSEGTSPLERARRIHASCTSSMAAHPGSPAVHVGWHLRPVLSRTSLRMRLRLDTLASTAVALAIVTLAALAMPPFSGVAAVLAWITLVLLASDSAEAFVNDVARRSLVRRWLPRMSERCVADERVAVAVPTLLIDEAHIDRIVGRMERNFTTTRGIRPLMVMLADFEDADAKDPSARDRQLLEWATRRVREANERHAAKDGHAVFALAWRERSWSSTEGCWIGRERKRGKLEAFFRATAGLPGELVWADESMAAGAKGTRYVVMLDDDNGLLPSTVVRLVAAMAHPLNPLAIGDQANPSTGFGILVPHIVDTDTPESYLDFAARNTTFDWYGRCLFPGKGIVQPQVALSRLEGRLPDEFILSHDTMEGFWMHPGFVGDAIVVEGSPTSYLKLCERIHRWTRGNWQNVAAMLSRPGRGNYGAYDWLVTIKLLKNSVAPIALFVFLAVAMLDLPSHSMPLAVGVAVAFGPMYVDILVNACVHAIRGDGWRGIARGVLGRLVFSALLLLNTPHRALLNAHAIVRTLLRVASGRHLLEWRAASKVETTGVRLAPPVVCLLAVTPLASLLLLRLWVAASPSMAAVLLSAAWALSPAMLWVLARPSETNEPARASDAGDSPPGIENISKP